MKNLKLGLLAAALLVGTQSFAQTESEGASAETTLKIDEAAGKTNTVDGTEEELITNKKMLAESGSKSKYSASTSLAYSGGSIKDPMNAIRPNITAAVGSKDYADLGGSIEGRYRLSKADSVSAGVGVTWVAPFETETPEGFESNRFDASEPYISYTRVAPWSGVQSVFSTGLTAFTDSFYRDLGYLAGLSFSANNIYNFGDSGFGAGLMLSGGVRAFDSEDAADKARQSDYYAGAYPFLEYTINDTFNLRTISGVWVYQHRRSENRAMTFSKNVIYQSVGLGVSVTRDIYLYPNIQFIPEDIRDDRTNVALSATLNVF